MIAETFRFLDVEKDFQGHFSIVHFVTCYYKKNLSFMGSEINFYEVFSIQEYQ